MKKIIVLVFIIASSVAYSQTWTENEGDFKVEWDRNVGGGVAITKYTGSKREVTIPARIQNYPVTSIGHMAFSECTSLTSVTIPNIRKTARFT
jgi:hypothetical protein